MDVKDVKVGVVWLNVLITGINMDNKEKAGYLMMLLVYFLIILLMISCNRHTYKGCILKKPTILHDYRTRF